jgi:dTMP kinase
MKPTDKTPQEFAAEMAVLEAKKKEEQLELQKRAEEERLKRLEQEKAQREREEAMKIARDEERKRIEIHEQKLREEADREDKARAAEEERLRILDEKRRAAEEYAPRVACRIGSWIVIAVFFIGRRRCDGTRQKSASVGR